MKENEILVLGASEKHKKFRLWGVLVACLLLLIIVAFFLVKGCGKQVEAPQDTTSTIDIELQHAVDSLLNAELELIGGAQGQVIVMEVETGEILAMAGRERRFDKQLYPCKNFAYQQEIFSMLSPISLLIALETGKVVLTDTEDTGNGVWTIDEELTLKDHNWRNGGYGKLTLERALEVSSSIAIGKTIWKLFKGHEQDYYNKLDSMSFGQPATIDGIEGMHSMSYHSPADSDWVNKDIIWSAVGSYHKIAPIQMLTFFNAIANNGKMVKPMLRKGKTEVINNQIAKRENIALMQQALEHVVSQGLGKRAGSILFKVAGKTGKSKVNEYYEGDNTVAEYHMGFCGYFPAEAPKYSIIVSLNKIGLPASAGSMAGVLFHDIVEWMVTHDRPTVLYVDDDTNDTTKVTKEI